MLEALLILPLLGFVFILASGLKAREAAIAAAREFCKQEEILLLDETVAQKRLRFIRGENGHLIVERTFAFEYSETGYDRTPGFIVLQAEKIVLIQTADQIYQIA